MVIAYIGLGANQGNCRENLLQAWSMLGAVKGVKLLVLSSPYSSEPVGMKSENWFINAVGSLQTSLEPGELLAEMLAIEESLGRKRTFSDHPQDRPVDLDLLYWNERVSNAPELFLPHPEIGERLFVLRPLAEIAPDFCHPVMKKTSAVMLQELLEKQQKDGQGCQVLRTTWSKVEGEVSE